jgi:hypothetical protein
VTTKFQQQTLEVIAQLMGQHGNINGTDQGGPSGSHWGDRIHTESSNNHNLAESMILRITRTLIPQLLTGNPIGAQ